MRNRFIGKSQCSAQVLFVSFTVWSVLMIVGISVKYPLYAQDSTAKPSPLQLFPSGSSPLLNAGAIQSNDSTVKIPIESQQNAKSEKAIARVMSRLVYKKDIEPPGKMKTEAKKQLGEKYAKWLEETRTQQLFLGIWEQMRQGYIVANNITASDAEVKSYIDNAKKIAVKQLPQAEAQLGQINQALKANTIPKDKLQEAQQYKQFLEQRIQAVKNTGKEPTAQEKEVARTLVVAWKFDRVLYKQYGGRVIAGQQSPYQPIGAYKTFMQDRQKEGLFEVYDKNMSAKFWALYDKAPKEANVPKEKVNYEKPWWEIAAQ